MQLSEPATCVLCATRPAADRAHVPGKLFFDRPFPQNLITVPSCKVCNQGLQHEEEYLRAFLMLLRGHAESPAIERVRERAVRQLDRQPKLRDGFLAGSKLRPEVAPDGRAILGLATSPDREKLWKALKVYARGLHFWSTGEMLPADAPASIERIFNREARPAEYWEPLLAASEFAGGGTVTTIGAHEQFRLSFRAVATGDALSVMVLDFYRSFPYVAMMMKPGTDFGSPVRLPF